MVGSNYPDPGEYNQNNDEDALQLLLDTDVAFEIVMVRCGQPSGTDAVRVTPDEIRARMAGRRPRVDEAIIEALGNSSKAWVTDDFVNHGYEVTTQSDRITLQSEGSEVEFRKLRLTPIAAFRNS
jgi:hypothetical protein